jgi:hypothetical protein
VRSVSFASSKAHSPLDKASASSCGTFLRDVYISIKPSADQISVVEAAIVAEFEVIFHQDEILRRMIGLDMVIQLRDDAVPFYVNGEWPIAFIDCAKITSLLDNHCGDKKDCSSQRGVGVDCFVSGYSEHEI